MESIVSESGVSVCVLLVFIAFAGFYVWTLLMCARCFVSVFFCFSTIFFLLSRVEHRFCSASAALLLMKIIPFRCCCCCKHKFKFKIEWWIFHLIQYLGTGSCAPKQANEIGKQKDSKLKDASAETSATWNSISPSSRLANSCVEWQPVFLKFQELNSYYLTIVNIQLFCVVCRCSSHQPHAYTASHLNF